MGGILNDDIEILSGLVARRWLLRERRRAADCACGYENGRLWPLRMAKCMNEGATTRGSGMRSTAVFGHRDRGERSEPSLDPLWILGGLSFLALARGLGGSSAWWLGGLTARQLTGTVVHVLTMRPPPKARPFSFLNY